MKKYEIALGTVFAVVLFGLCYALLKGIIGAGTFGGAILGFYAAYSMVIYLISVLQKRWEIANGKRLTNGEPVTSFGGLTYYGQHSDDGQHFRWLELTDDKRHEFIDTGLLKVPGRRHSFFAMAFTGG